MEGHKSVRLCRSWPSFVCVCVFFFFLCVCVCWVDFDDFHSVLDAAQRKEKSEGGECVFCFVVVDVRCKRCFIQHQATGDGKAVPGYGKASAYLNSKVCVCVCVCVCFVFCFVRMRTFASV